jgi:membrane protease YdiL (CAAX protease family)
MEDRIAINCVPALARRNAASARSKRRDLFEIAIVYAAVLLVFWTPRPWQYLLWAVTAALIAASIFQTFDGLKHLGLCRGDLSGSLWAVAASMAVASAAVAMAGLMHTLHLPGTPGSFIRCTFTYALWATIQQLVLQCFFLSRLLRLLGDATWAAVAAAILFAVAHLPSPILTLITLICGLAACLFFLRYRSLYPLAAAHAILGLSIAITVPAPVDHNMSVGLAYITYAEKPAATAFLGNPVSQGN